MAFSPEEERDLGLGETLGLAGLYCQQCARCLPQCPAGLDIPTLMRGYMYAAGYQDPAAARRTAGARLAAHNPRAGCTSCRVRCALGFDVGARVRDVTQLLQAG